MIFLLFNLHASSQPRPRPHVIHVVTSFIFFMSVLCSSCSITFHYSGQLTYWKINSLCCSIKSFAYASSVGRSVKRQFFGEGRWRWTAQQKWQGETKGWFMAWGHRTGCINTVRQDPRIVRRAESAFQQQLPAARGRDGRNVCILVRWPDAKGTERQKRRGERTTQGSC